jgi:hypothetical protein
LVRADVSDGERAQSGEIGMWHGPRHDSKFTVAKCCSVKEGPCIVGVGIASGLGGLVRDEPHRPLVGKMEYAASEGGLADPGIRAQQQKSSHHGSSPSLVAFLFTEVIGRVVVI